MNKHKATILLIIVTLGFLIAYPFHQSFLGGLLTSAFCASMIGGFADWYGITALFHKPLGISFKTELVPKNRDKIINEICNVVTEELITVDSLNKFIDEYDFSETIVLYIKKNQNNEQLKAEILSVIYKALELKDEETLEVISKLFRENLSKISLWSLIKTSLEASMKSGYDEKIIDFILEELIILSNSQDLLMVLKDMAAATKTYYENGMARRKFVNNFVMDILLQTSPENIAVSLQQKILSYLAAAKKPYSPSRENLKIWLYAKFDEYKDNPKLISVVENLKSSKLESFLSSDNLRNMINKIRSGGLKEEEGSDRFSLKVYKQLIAAINNFENNAKLQNSVNEGLKNAASTVMESLHSNLKSIIQSNLDNYSNEQLIELIESKAGDDLQLIRINGSIVGGFVGLLAFIINSITF